MRLQQANQVGPGVVPAPPHAGHGGVALAPAARFLHVAVDIEAVQPGQPPRSRHAQEQPAAGSQHPGGLRQGLFLLHRQGQLIQQHHGVEAGVREGPLHNRRRERDTSQLRQRPHIRRVAGDSEPGPQQVAGLAVVATDQQHGPAARQVLGQREPRNGHTMHHAGYDREQECQEPT